MRKRPRLGIKKAIRCAGRGIDRLSTKDGKEIKIKKAREAAESDTSDSADRDKANNDGKTAGNAGGAENADDADDAAGAAGAAGAADADSAEGADGEETDASAADPRQEAEQLKDQLLRLTADFDNFRKRTLRDKQDWSRYASQNLIEKLIPVMDNLDAAAMALSDSGQEAKGVAEGFLMIHKQLTEVLSQEGLAEIPALGEMFDPNIHEAVMTVERSEDQEDNQVVMVMRKGYIYKDKVLRPTMVQVAKEI